MQIQELAQRTGLPPSTIRYYESIDLLPPPRRQPNGYRLYREADVDRLRLVAGLRALDYSIDDIAEILALRDRGEAPCRVVLELLAHKADEIQRRVTELERLETELRQLHRLGLTFPTDDVDGKNCVCHLVSQQAGSQQAGKEKK
jgi:DNA-binding transcriptional MerR regulator